MDRGTPKGTAPDRRLAEQQDPERSRKRVGVFRFPGAKQGRFIEAAFPNRGRGVSVAKIVGLRKDDVNDATRLDAVFGRQFGNQSSDGHLHRGPGVFLELNRSPEGVYLHSLLILRIGPKKDYQDLHREPKGQPDEGPNDAENKTSEKKMVTPNAPQCHEHRVIEACYGTDATGGLYQDQKQSLSSIEKTLIVPDYVETKGEKRQYQEKYGQTLDKSKRDRENRPAVGVMVLLICVLHLPS